MKSTYNHCAYIYQSLKNVIENSPLVLKFLGNNMEHSENEDHGIWSHHFMANRWGKSGNSGKLYFGGLQNHFR